MLLLVKVQPGLFQHLTFTAKGSILIHQHYPGIVVSLMM